MLRDSLLCLETPSLLCSYQEGERFPTTPRAQNTGHLTMVLEEAKEKRDGIYVYLYVYLHIPQAFQNLG